MSDEGQAAPADAAKPSTKLPAASDASSSEPPKAAPSADPRAARRDVLRRCGLALLTGACMFSSVPDWGLWWLGFVGWIPLWIAIEDQTPRRAYLYGLLAGTFAIYVGFFWMTEMLTRFAGFGMPAAAGVHLLFSAAQGHVWALTALFVTLIRRRTGRPLTWVAGPVWAVLEWLWPAIFPTFMALAWCERPLWIQFAELGGPQAVGFVIVTINAAAWQAIASSRSPEGLDRRALAVLATLLVGTPLYGWVRMRSIDAEIAAADTVRFGVVQPNFGIRTFASGRMKPILLAELQRTTAELEAEGAQIALWGETAYPYANFKRASTTDLPQSHKRRVRRGFTIPVIFGAVMYDDTEDKPRPWNSAIALDEDGEIVGRYDKVYPLIFGEWVPFVDPDWYLANIPNASYINIGPGPQAIEIAGLRLGPLICYEDILPNYARSVARENVSVFINLTNDSWFGKSREQSEHLGLAVFRAIEHRRPLLRAVVAGQSAYVDPNGRILVRLLATDSDVDPYQGAEGFVVDVPILEPTRQTVFGRVGNLFSVLCALAIALLWGWPVKRQADPTAAT